MSEQTDFRDELTSEINASGSTVTIIPRTLVEGSYGGYEPGSDTEGTSVTTKGLPSEYLLSKSGQPFGKLKEGEAVIVLKYDEVVEKDYKVTWKSDSYTIQEVKEITMADTILGKRIKISRRID